MSYVNKYMSIAKGEIDLTYNNRIEYLDYQKFYNFAVLKHEKYYLSWKFDLNVRELNSIALFALIVNGYDEKAILLINDFIKINVNIDFSYVYDIARVEYFPCASLYICNYIINHGLCNENAEICYAISAWNIIGNYDIPNLKYSFDHETIAKKYNYKLDTQDRDLDIGPLGMSLSKARLYNNDKCILQAPDYEEFISLWNEPCLFDIENTISDDYDRERYI